MCVGGQVEGGIVQLTGDTLLCTVFCVLCYATLLPVQLLTLRTYTGWPQL